VGVTGNSGGGTQTTWLCGLEQRWAMAAPSCFVTTFRRNAENELPADTEQCPPRVLALDLDHSDFLAAQAPRPVMILAQEKDYFDARGATEAHQRLARLYDLLGHPGGARLHIGGDYHGYSQVNREGMYRFFNEISGASDAQTEPALVIEKDETLWCLPGGQAGSDGQARTIFSFTRELAQQLTAARPSSQGEALQKAVREVLKIPAAQGVPDYRILRTISGRQYPAKGYCSYAVETEPGIHALVTRLHEDTSPPARPRAASAPCSTSPTAPPMPNCAPSRWWPTSSKEEADADFYACDLRGIGDSQPDICGVNQFAAALRQRLFPPPTAHARPPLPGPARV
jgi:hypothetical protein